MKIQLAIIKSLFTANLILLLNVLTYENVLFAQASHLQVLKIKKSDSRIRIDGILDESSWRLADSVTNFWEKWPKDDNHPWNQTVVYAMYDDSNLYFGAVCYDSGTHVIQSLKRDTRYWDSDGFSVILDPTHQRTNGYVFGVSPENVQSETLIGTNGGFGDFTWDNKWLSAVKQFKDRWVVEIAIPFRSLTFAEGKKDWGINFLRNDIKNNKYHSWMQIPVQLFGNDLGYNGVLEWDTAPVKKSGNIQILPYSTLSSSKVPEEKSSISSTAGVDAKVAITSSLNMDVTLNPDFSQVEVDQQQINLTRFNLFFPERRQFFVENSDIFASFANDVVSPIYTRTIGLDKNGARIPLLGGVRLNGNITNRLRVGLMDMQTQARPDNGAKENYAALAINYRVLSRSSVKGYFTNVQEVAGIATNGYARNGGVELLYVSTNGNVAAWASGHFSSTTKAGADKFLRAGGSYNSSTFRASTDITHMGTNYFTGMGFLQRIENYDAQREITIRQGFTYVRSLAEYAFRKIRGNKINIITSTLDSYIYLNPDGSLNERILTFSNPILFRNTSSLTFIADSRETNLLYPFRFTDKVPLPAGVYRYGTGGISYKTDDRKKLRLNVSFTTGTFYNGIIKQYISGIIFRQQPYLNASVNIERYELTFPEEIGVSNRTLINSRIEVFFNNKINWTTFFQINTQSNNININSRIQYRYRPMSDIFLVYTDNYFNDPLFRDKSRAIVIKLNYWFSI